MSLADTKIKIKLDYLLFVLISSLVGLLIINNSKLVGLVSLLGMFFLIFLLKRDWVIYAIIIVLFFEGYAFSFYFAGARIRAVQVVEVIALISLLVVIFMGKIKLKRTPLDFFLWAYISVNFIALINAPSARRSLKIAILLLSLALLYYIIVNFITKRKLFNKTLNLLLYVGLAEILFGLYQVFAGVCDYYLNINLPVGHRGIVHRKFIGSPWGRPYGTLVEPDWYGAISMFYALLFITLYFSRLTERKNFYLFGMVVSILGMLLSFVRVSWFGFLGGLLFLLVFGHKVKASKISFGVLSKIFFSLVFLVLVMTFFSPTFKNIIERRLTTKGEAGISTANVRFVQARYAIKLFLNHPIIGNGPGSFAVKGIWGHAEEYYQQLVEEGKLSVERRYDPSLVTTVLEDTGIIGAFVFILLSLAFLRYNLRIIPKIDNHYQVISLGLCVGLIGLFFSYVFTHGFWISFTWVFLGLNICALKLGLIERKREREREMKP